MAAADDGALVEGRSRTTLGTSTTVVALVFAIAALYVGREIFVPLALAVLLSFLLAPLVSFFQRHHIPRIPAVVLVVALAFSIVLGFALVVGGQLTQVAADLPEYKSNIQTKIRDIKITGPNSIFARFTGLVEDIGDEVVKPAEPASPTRPGESN
jgi:predicted PurR-regulated permease PerM